MIHTSHSTFPGSPSTYYDTEITAKSTKSKKIVFVRVSNHKVTDNQAQINDLERPGKAKAYLNKGLDEDDQIKDVQKGVHWDEFKITLEGKSYTSWDIVFREIKKRIKDYAELNILK